MISNPITPQLLFATRNRWKKRLFEPVFCSYGFKVVTLNDRPTLPAPPPETGATPIENALVKARHYHSTSFPWVFGDDAGLEIDALDGEPGVRTRRWNGVFNADVDDQIWLEYLLKRMASVPVGERTAAFVAGWVLIAPDGKAYCRDVRAPFEISTLPIRSISPGSPITAVRIGPADDLGHRQAEICSEWEQWGILEKLLRTS